MDALIVSQVVDNLLVVLVRDRRCSRVTLGNGQLPHDGIFRLLGVLRHLVIRPLRFRLVGTVG